MWSKRRILCVCLLTSTALAPALVSQSSSSAAEAHSDQDNRPSKAWALCQKLSRKQVQAKPSADNAQNDPRRGSLCAL
jgi:hypothetical protein